MVELFQKGGPLMWPLLACSVLMLAAILERAYAFLLANRDVDSLAEDVEIAVRKGDVGYAGERCRHVGGPVAAVLAAGLQAAHHSRDEMRERMEAAGGAQLAGLERYLTVLSTVANIAPLLGFLGTVWGMILAFEAIAARGLGDPAVVANGISQALITTAAGLAIAIPSFFFYNVFMGRAEAYATEMEQRAHHLVRLFFEKEHGNADQAAPAH